MLQESTIQLLCSIPRQVVAESAPDLNAKAVEVEDKFTQLFTKFGKCHTVYNAMKVFEDEEIDHLGECIVHALRLMDLISNDSTLQKRRKDKHHPIDHT